MRPELRLATSWFNEILDTRFKRATTRTSPDCRRDASINVLANRAGINQRRSDVEDRSDNGHDEMDRVRDAKQASVLVTQV